MEDIKKKFNSYLTSFKNCSIRKKLHCLLFNQFRVEIHLSSKCSKSVSVLVDKEFSFSFEGARTSGIGRKNNIFRDENNNVSDYSICKSLRART